MRSFCIEHPTFKREGYPTGRRYPSGWGIDWDSHRDRIWPGRQWTESPGSGRIFQAKGRPQDNPLILHIPSIDHLDRYCKGIPLTAYRLAERFWPGPLTMILARRDVVPDVVTAGLDTVGMRCPAHALCRAILRDAMSPWPHPQGILWAAQSHLRRPYVGGYGWKD